MQTIASEILINSYQVTHQAMSGQTSTHQRFVKRANTMDDTSHHTHDTYEFILNDEMYVTECIRIEPVPKAAKMPFSTCEAYPSRVGARDGVNQLGLVRPIKNSTTELDGMLFELNHVRVNPKLDNSEIIYHLTKALNQIGVRVSNQPDKDSMAICFKPLGEISESVRFYLNKEGKLIFLSPAMRPRLVYSKPKTN
jgi:hypothetical protein